MDAAFADAVRDLLASLASGTEPPVPATGGLARVLRETGSTTSRAAVTSLVDRWFRAPPPRHADDLPFNRTDLDDDEKIHLILHEHVIARRRWQDLSTNESTFYRYRRTATAAFTEHLWSEIVGRPVPTNRPQPEYQRLIGRQGEVATLLRWLDEPGGTVVGIEGPGGS